VARWRGEGREIGLDGLLVLSFLSDNAFIDTLSAAKLLQLPREDARATLDRLALPGTGSWREKVGPGQQPFISPRVLPGICSARRRIRGPGAWTRFAMLRW
jgi:hypothetical protein